MLILRKVVKSYHNRNHSHGRIAELGALMKISQILVCALLALVCVGCATDNRPRGPLGGRLDTPVRAVEVPGMGIGHSSAISQTIIIDNGSDHPVRLSLNGVPTPSILMPSSGYRETAIRVYRDMDVVVKAEYLEGQRVIGFWTDRLTLRSQNYSYGGYGNDFPPMVVENLVIPRFEPRRR
jgi:hypothetical protein